MSVFFGEPPFTSQLKQRETTGSSFFARNCANPNTWTVEEMDEKLLQAVLARDSITVRCVAQESIRRRRAFLLEATTLWATYPQRKRIFLLGYCDSIRGGMLARANMPEMLIDTDTVTYESVRTEINRIAFLEFELESDYSDDSEEEMSDDSEDSEHGDVSRKLILDDKFLFELTLEILVAFANHIAFQPETSVTKTLLCLQIICALFNSGMSPTLFINKDFTYNFDKEEDYELQAGATVVDLLQRLQSMHIVSLGPLIEHLNFMFENWH